LFGKYETCLTFYRGSLGKDLMFKVFLSFLLVTVYAVGEGNYITRKYLENNGFSLMECAQSINSTCSSKICCIRSESWKNITGLVTSYCAADGAIRCCGCNNDQDATSCSSCVALNFCGPNYECMNIFGLIIPGVIIGLVLVAVLTSILYYHFQE